jgi:hypothetical protein
MINTTDHPIVLIEGNQLHKNIIFAMDWAIDALHKRLSENESNSGAKNAFEIFVEESNRRDRPYDESFIQSVFNFVESDAQNRDAKQPMMEIAKYMGKPTVAANGFAVNKRGFKLVLVSLWCQGSLILPSKFTPGTHFQYELFDNEILKWLLTFDAKTKGDKGKTDTRRLYYSGPRLLLTTTWSSFEDIDINEIAELHDAWMNYSVGKHPHSLTCSQFPWTQLTSSVLNQYPDRSSFTEADLVRYSAWSLRDNRGKFEQFTTDVISSKLVNPRPPPLPGHISHTKRSPDYLVAEVKEATTHESILSIFDKFGQRHVQMNWVSGTPTYQGREHIDVENLSKNWLPAIRSWLDYRKNLKRYRTDHDVRAALNILVDYLFLYLPWWKEIYPNVAFDFPNAPKSFKRYQFVSRHQPVEAQHMPATLLQIIKIRRKTADTQNLVIKHLYLFFRYVQTFLRDDEVSVGESFRNPIDEEFDTTRGEGSKNKTNKTIIPRGIYGYMLFYLYSVEAFGQYLLERALNGEVADSLLKLRATPVYKAEDFGFIPILKYQKVTFPVKEIPNVFTWSQRRLNQDGGEKLCWIPHLSALRLCIVGLEMGLRFQSIQWLDRDTWDSFNLGLLKQHIYRLLVNTDKTKDKAWDVPIVYRVRDLLLREQTFQKLFTDYESASQVFYEGNETSPFKPIRPLFKSATAANPILDQTYYDTWTSLQVNFEIFYRRVTNERHIRLFYLERVKAPNKEIKIKYIGKEEIPYCPISIRVIHTPHACRATFATNRQGEGTLDVSDCQMLMGHQNTVTTTHYTKYSAEQLEEHLHRSDIALLSDFSIFDLGSESGYIRADTAESALVQSFTKDRERAIKNYHFMPSMSLWTIDDQKFSDNDGLSMLKEGPMSHIRFRETHICPVGEECPSDIVQGIGAAKRCGICPLAMKCIDHLPAIAAKKNLLTERIKFHRARHTQLEEAKEPISTLDAIWDELQLDINEYLGWDFSEQTLNTLLVQAQQDGSNELLFHADRPDIVRRHLTLVTRQTEKTEFLLQRLAESNAFPSMTSPQVQAAAVVLRRRFSAGIGLDSFSDILGSNDDVRTAAKMLSTMMKSSGLSVKDLASILDGTSVAQISNGTKLKLETVNG